jgi:hypothetical protein
MAESPEQSTSVTTDAKPAGPEPLLGLPSEERAEPYRPLSLLAIGGFSLAVLFAAAVTMGGLAAFAGRHSLMFKILLGLGPLAAVLLAAMRRERQPAQMASFVGLLILAAAAILGLGSLVAYSSESPWLLPWPMWLVVIAAAVLSWAARVRIGASENTLSGDALARWGLGMSLFFGIIYAAYLAGNDWGVRGQARACVEDFLKQLEQGDVMQAFIRSIPPDSRPAPGKERDTVEITWNISRGREPGAYSAFENSDLVRLLLLSGKEARLEPINFTPDFDKGFYRVIFRYKVTMPMGNVDAAVAALGRDTSTGRRRWYIDLSHTGIIGRPILNEEGDRLAQLHGAATRFARRWGTRVQKHDLDEAYLDTVPGDQREAQQEVKARCSAALMGAAGLAPLAHALQSPAGRAYQEGRQAFAEAKLVDVKKFYAIPKAKERMLAAIHSVFAGTISVPFEFDMVSAGVPLAEKEGKQTRLRGPCRLTFQQPNGMQDFVLEGEVVVDVPEKPGGDSSTLRVHSLRLLRGKSGELPTAPPPPPPRR